MYYSKHHLTELYRRYFYGKNDTTNGAIQDKKSHRQNRYFATSTNNSDIKGTNQYTKRIQENVSTFPSDNSADMPKPFSFQVIEKIILGINPFCNPIFHYIFFSSIVLRFLDWSVDAAFNTVFIWYFSDYPTTIASQQGEVASKDSRHLSNDISGSTERKKTRQIAKDVILRIVSHIKGSYTTGFR